MHATFHGLILLKQPPKFDTTANATKECTFFPPTFLTLTPSDCLASNSVCWHSAALL